MSKKFLNCAQVASGVQQVGRKAMPHRVGSRRRRQSKLAADRRHDLLNVAGVQHAAPHAAKRRVGADQFERASSHIGLDRCACLRDHGHQTFFLTFPDNTKHLTDRKIARGEAKGLGDAKAAAV